MDTEGYDTIDEPANIRQVPKELRVVPPGLHHVHTMFGEVPERNVAFCIDTSGSMHSSLKVIQQHLVETCLKHAFREGKTKFNIMTFDFEVKKWTDRLVECTPDSVAASVAWVRDNFKAKGSSRILPVLLDAFRDRDVDAVYIATDNYPGYEDPPEIIDHLETVSKGRPIHCLYVSDRLPADQKTAEFLQSMAHTTMGSFRIVGVTKHGALQRVTPVYIAPKSYCPAPRNLIYKGGYRNPRLAVSAQLARDPLSEPVYTGPGMIEDPRTGEVSPFYHPYNHWVFPGQPVLAPAVHGCHGTLTYGMTKHRASRAFLQGHHHLDRYSDNPYLTPSAGAMMIGRTILAQMRDDGVFYIATVKSQLGPCLFLLEFEALNSDSEPIYIEASLTGTLSFEDSHRHPIATGDTILAPRGSNITDVALGCDAKQGVVPYLPAKVVAGHENRDTKCEGHDMTLYIKWADKNESEEPLQKNVAVWLPRPIYNEAVRKMEMTTHDETDHTQQLCLVSHEDSTKSTVAHCDVKRVPHHHHHNIGCYGDTSAVAPLCDHAVFPRGIHSKGPRERVDNSRDDIEARAAALRTQQEPVYRKPSQENDSSESECSGSEVDGSEIDSDVEEYIPISNFKDRSYELYRSFQNRVGKSTGDLTKDMILCPPPRNRRKKKTKKVKKVDTRPPWKYWASDKVPDINDPPIFEPYQTPEEAAQKFENEKTRILENENHGVDCAGSSFHRLEKGAITFDHPRKMYDVIRHRVHQASPPPLRRSQSVSPGPPQKDPWEMECNRWEQGTRYQHGGYPNLGNHRIPTQDSVRGIFQEDSRQRSAFQLNRYSKEIEKVSLPKQAETRDERIARIRTKYGELKGSQPAIETSQEGSWMVSAVRCSTHSKMATSQISRA